MKIREDFLPMSRPSIGDKEIEGVVQCLKSGWITTGPLCQAFEEKFREITGASHATSVCSGTAGMHLIMLALGIKEGDEVITPSMTFASTLNMITLYGGRPVFVDICYDTLNIDADRIEEKITKRTKAIIPVHFAGCPVDMDKLLQVAARFNLPVIEDAAHALGTFYRGVPAGGFGHIAIFSFHPIKNITTGEGGMIVHSDDALEKELRLLRFHGIERDAWKRYGKGGNPEYDISTPGFKYNLTDIQAALGLAQLARLDELNRRRKRLADLYMKGLEGIEGLELPGVPAYPHTHSWHLFVVKIISMERERFMGKLADYQIGYGIHFPAAHRLSYIQKRLGMRKEDLKETERASDRILSLPLFPDMKDEDASYVCDAIKEILEVMDKGLMISLVIPVYNEETNLPTLMGRIRTVMEKLARRWEIIFIDDGSSDQSLSMLKDFSTQPGVRVVELTRNYGQHAAILSGFSIAKGDIIITLDADLQNPPEEIPNLVKAMEQGNYDVVGTIRRNRRDSILRTLPSRLMNVIARKITKCNMKDWGCMLRAYRRSVVERMVNCHEQSTFIPALATFFAKRVAEIEVAHEERRGGESNYSLRKLINLQFDLISSFSDFPLKIMMYAGIGMAFLGISFGIVLGVARVVYGARWAAEGVFTLFAVLFGFVGFQFFALGVMGEYVSRIYREVRKRPEYVIQTIHSSGSGGEDR